jgi:DnaJ-class molecular chaperone
MQKILKSLNSFTNNKDKPKFCVYCGNMATQEAFFDVGDGVIVVEKYCDKCNGRINLRVRNKDFYS